MRNNTSVSKNYLKKIVKNILPYAIVQQYTEYKANRLQEFYKFSNIEFIKKQFSSVSQKNSNAHYHKEYDELDKKFNKIVVYCSRETTIGNMTHQFFSFCKYLKDKLDDSNSLYLYIFENEKENRKHKSANTWLSSKIKSSMVEVTIENSDYWIGYLNRRRDFILYNIEYSIKKNRLDYPKLINNPEVKYITECITFSDQEEKDAKNELQKLEITTPYVCIFTREDAYYDKVIEWDEQIRALEKINSLYRNDPITDFTMLASYLNNKSVQSVRMGSVVNSQFKAPGVIDYANLQRSEFLDIYLSAKCKFFICNPSGISFISLLFSKPVVWVNCPIHFINSEVVLYCTLIIFKTFIDNASGRKLSLRDHIRLLTQADINAVGSIFWRYCYDHNISAIPNTQEEIMEAGEEMLAILDGHMVYTEEDRRLQQQYRNIFVEAFAEHRLYGMTGRVGAKWLRKNADWFLA